MAALADEQLFDEAGDTDFAIYADLAKQRAARKGQSIEITERERVTIAANDNAEGPVTRRTTTTTNSPVAQRYASAPANDNADNPPGVGAIEQPSPAFVSPESVPNSAPLEEAKAQPPAEPTTSPAATDAVPGASSNGLSRADAPDYADQFNKAPETGNAPLVGDDGEPVGIQRAADPALAGMESLPADAGESQQTMPSEIDEEGGGQQPGMIDRAKNSLKQGVNDNMSGIMAFKNRKKIKELQDAINKIEEEIKKVERELDILNRKIADYKKKEITPLERQALLAGLSDAGFAIRNYLLIMVEIWWWTIIGAIIDICLVIPTIAILYSSGALKGSLGKKIEKELSKKKRVFKAMEKTRRPLERQIFRFRQEQQQLAQQQFQLTQLFKLEQQQASGGPPSAGGIPLAS